MDPKIVNTDEDTLNPMADVRNYGAGEEDGRNREMEDIKERDEEDKGYDEDPDKNAFDEPEIKDDEPFPDEIVDPAEDDSESEKP
jgi:hypothetical protein